MSFDKIEKKEIFPPETCPVCGTKVEFDGTWYFCPNESCPGKVIGKIYKWVENLEIKFLGEELVKKLIVKGKVRNVADIYRLTEKDFDELEGVGRKHFAKIQKHLRRALTWAEILGSLSIEHFNIKTAENFVKEYKIETLEDLERVTAKEFVNQFMGPTKSPLICKGISKNWKLLEDLLVFVRIKSEVKVSGPLSGKSFLFTGSATDSSGNPLKRGRLEEMAKEKGGMIGSSVTKDLTYLVSADIESNSSKSVKARNLGVKIISVPEFLDLAK